MVSQLTFYLEQNKCKVLKTEEQSLIQQVKQIPSVMFTFGALMDVTILRETEFHPETPTSSQRQIPE